MSEPPDIVEAHRLCSQHREAVLGAARCGCFYCCAVFAPAEIEFWVDPPTGDDDDDLERGTTALCPRCGIDSVLPLGPGMDVAFLEHMKAYWF